jgi:predicted NACHT family NTPase
MSYTSSARRVGDQCGDTTYFIVDCPKRKKFDFSNKYNYANQNDSSNKGFNKKKNRFGDEKKKKSSRRSCFEHVLP